MKEESTFQEFEDLSFDDEVDFKKQEYNDVIESELPKKQPEFNEKKEFVVKQTNTRPNIQNPVNTHQTYTEKCNDKYNARQLKEAKEEWLNKLLWLLIFAIGAGLCFFYCYVADSQYRELPTNFLGTYYIWKVNWLWCISGIVMIVFGVKTITKYNEMKKSYKKYKHYKSPIK